ncbi:MAG TPA: glycosyltransferase family 4 protein [Gemmatimonadaceae bacterium]|nr:glycosyltransferase family 4 protein [Gemmatimonadaceae bacterium]
MRILFSFEYPFEPDGYGGGQQIARGLARGLARMGHEVHVACTGTDRMHVAQQDAGVQYHFAGTFDRRLSSAIAARVAIGAVRRLRPEIVCSYTSEAPLVLAVARALGARTMMYLAAPELPPFARLHGGWLRDVRYGVGSFMQFAGAHVAHETVAISHWLASQAATRWKLRAVTAIGAGLDEAMMAPAVPAPQVPPAGVRLLSIGRLALSQKPLDRVAQALAACSAAWSSWTIVGSGEDRARLEAIVVRAGLSGRVTFRGTLTPAETCRALDEHHVVILPSNHESFFITVHESVARGRVIVTNPVAEVASEFGGIRSVVVAPSTDVAALERAITHAISSYFTLAPSALTAAGGHANRHSWDAVAGAFLRASGYHGARP